MSCCTRTYNLEWIAGNTEQLEYRLLDSDLNPEDLTGGNAELALKLKLEDSTIALTVDGEVGTTDGTIKFTVTPSETENLLPVDRRKISYYYDMEFTDSNGNVDTVMHGRVFVTRSVLS